MNKICSRCNIEKDLNEFPIDSAKKDGHRYECKACQSKVRKASYLRGGEKERVMHREWINKNKAQQKEYNRKTKMFKAYGITENDFNTMFNNQKGCCAICGKHQTEVKRCLFIDHDHETNKVRSLLCMNCNFILGHSFEDIDILEKTIQYIKKYSP